MEILKIFVQFVLPSFISLLGLIYANKKSKEIAETEAKNNSDKIKKEFETKTTEIEKNYETKMAEIKSNYNTEIDKIKAESDREINRLKLEYEQQKESRQNEDVMSLLRGEFDLSKTKKSLEDLKEMINILGIDFDNIKKYSD